MQEAAGTSKLRNLVWFLIFMVSMSLLVFEISLTRIFSLVVWYHFVFLAISTAILGLGLGGILGSHLVTGQDGNVELGLIMKLLLALAAALPSTSALLLWVPYSYFVLYGLAVLPFILGGTVLSLVFAWGRQQGWVHQFYFADLSGASLGSLAVVPLLASWGPLATTSLVGLMISAATVGLVFFKRFKRKRFSYRLPLALMIGLLFVAVVVISYPQAELTLMSMGSPKPMFAYLTDPDRQGEVVFTRWSSMARTDVVRAGAFESNLMTIFTDGAAATSMYRFDGDLSEIDFLKREAGYLPFADSSTGDVLVIGPGGGKDILFGLLGESERITAVEVNPGIVEAVREFSSFNGGIFDLPGVEIIVDDGRSFVRRTQDEYDLIYLSLVMTLAAEPIGYSLVENYIFTTEAFHDYLDVLRDDGQLVFVLHDGRDLLKAVTTALQALKERGVPMEQATQHLAFINGTPGHTNHIHKPLLVVRNTPFTSAASEALLSQALERNLPPIHIPHVAETDALVLMGGGQITLEEYISHSQTNIQPATDNRPFFYNFDRSIPKYMLILLLVVSGVIVAAFAWLRRRWPQARLPFYPYSGYFTALGVGFMLVEIPLLQQLGFFLGRPTLAISLTLFAILFGGGLGSLFSSRLIPDPERRLQLALPAVAIVALVYQLALPGVMNQFLLQPLATRIVLTVVFALPVGFLLGIPFPTGLSLVPAGRPREVSTLWAVNGLTSVLGSVLAVVLSLQFGFRFTLAVGALVYLAALWFAHRMPGKT